MPLAYKRRRGRTHSEKWTDREAEREQGREKARSPPALLPLPETQGYFTSSVARSSKQVHVHGQCTTKTSKMQPCPSCMPVHVLPKMMRLPYHQLLASTCDRACRRRASAVCHLATYSRPLACLPELTTSKKGYQRGVRRPLGPERNSWLKPLLAVHGGRRVRRAPWSLLGSRTQHL